MAKTPNWLTRIFGQGREQNKARSDAALMQALAPTAEQTIASPLVGAAAVANEPKPNVSLNWKVGDVILDLYEVKKIREGAEKHYAEGGMGRVYRVYHKGWNVDLAVKVPLAKSFQNQTHRENFTRECLTWIGLGLHPHIVCCHYVLQFGGIPRVFAEYVQGGSLKDWIESRKLYEGGPEEALKRIVDIAIQFAWGLDYAHEQGLVHQDVKPANVMMTPEGVAKVTDFGLAKARAVTGEAVIGGGRSILVSFAGGMTPAYCSPEQAQIQAMRKTLMAEEMLPKLTRKTDLWSWAISVLEMFTGEVTWEQGNIADSILQGYLQSKNTDPCIPRMPRAVAELLQRCFQRPSQDRPKDLLDVAVVLVNLYKQYAHNDFPRTQPAKAEGLADALSNEGLSLVELGLKEEGEKKFEAALEIEPGHPYATYNRGLLMWRSSRMTDQTLVTQLREGSASRSQRGRATLLEAYVQMERGDAESAVSLLEKLTNTDCEDAEVRVALQKARTGIGRWPRCLRTYEGHTDGIYSVALSGDGRLALSASHDHTLRQWEVSTGRCLRTFEGHKDSVSSVFLSVDGRWALSGSSDHTLRLWELSTGHCLRTFEGHTANVHSVVLSGDGRLALSGSWDNTLRLWDVSSGRCLRTFEGHTSWVYSVSLSSDGRWALSGSEDWTLRLWEVSTGRCLRTFEGHTANVGSVALSVNGRWALSGSRDHTLRLWEVSTGRCLRTFEGHTASVFSVALSVDGRWALSGSQDHTLRLWEVSTGRCLRTFEGHTNEIWSAFLGVDRGWALSGSWDKTLRLWDLAGERGACPGAAKAPLAPCHMMTSEAALQSDQAFARLMARGQRAASQGDWSGVLATVTEARRLPQRVMDSSALALQTRAGLFARRSGFSAGWHVRTFQGHTNWIESVCLSVDGRWALSGSFDHTFRLWEASTGRCLRTFEGHTESIESLALSHDGRWALSGSRDATLRLWEVSTGRCLRTFDATFDGQKRWVSSVSLSGDGRWALSGSWHHTLQLWEVSTGQCLRTFKGHADGVTTVALSGDGRWALSGSADKTLRLWELSTGRCLRTFEGHTDRLFSVSLSGDGRWALSGSDDKTLRLWEVSTGRCLRTFEGHTAVFLGGDGRWALSGSYDKTLRLWEVSTGRCLRTFEGHTSGVATVSLSGDGRWGLSGGDNTLRLWELDWSYQFPGWSDWDQGARPYLANFLTLHTPYAGSLPAKGDRSEQQVQLALTRRGQPMWTDAEFQQLITALQHAGYGWLRPEGVRRELEKMAADWQGPPPMPGA